MLAQVYDLIEVDAQIIWNLISHEPPKFYFLLF